MTALAIPDRREMQLANPATIHPAAALLAAITSGQITADNAKTALEVYERMDATRRQQEYASALANLQGQLPPVVAKRFIPNNDGTPRSFFAAYEDVMAVLTPILRTNGLTISWDSETTDKSVKAICIIMHTSGHSERRSFSVHISAPPKASEAQADGATLTYAKRRCLCNAFNITTPNEDDDARATGDTITPEQAADLKQRATVIGKEKGFLKFANVASFENIPTAQYNRLNNALKERERQFYEESK